MKKIPSIYVRDEQDRRYVTATINPGCEWVFNGEGVPTRKWDGTCVMFDGEEWWARRELKPGQNRPPGFRAVDPDPVTNKVMGWVPMNDSGWVKFHHEALAGQTFAPGTYELVGPKVNRNPEGVTSHLLIKHGVHPLPSDRHPAILIKECRTMGWEGVVWHHPDGRMAKLKVEDVRAPCDEVDQSAVAA